MRTQVKSPPIHAASGSAAMMAPISNHSVIIRTSGVNRVIGTSNAATRPAAPNRPSNSAPDSSGPPAVAGECTNVFDDADAYRGHCRANQRDRLALVGESPPTADEDQDEQPGQYHCGNTVAMAWRQRGPHRGGQRRPCGHADAGQHTVRRHGTGRDLCAARCRVRG